MTETRHSETVPGASDRRIALRLAVYYGVYFAVMGIHMPFWPLWLKSRGLGPEEIGIVVAIGVLARVITAPMIAHFADRRGERRRLMVVLAALSALSFALFQATTGFWTIILVTLLFLPFWSGIMPLGENLTVVTCQERGLVYGRVRLWGSMSFIAFAVITGQALVGRPADLVFWLILGFCVLLIAACAQLPDHRPPPGPAPRFPMRQLLGDRVFAGFLAAMTLVHGSHGVYYAFSSLHWKTAGYSEVVIGVLWAEGVLAEVVLFAASAGLVRRVPPMTLIALGGVAATIRWVALGLTTALPVLILAQALHAFSYGAAHLGAMNFILRTVPANRAATAQALYSAIGFGFGIGVVTLFSGKLFAALGGLAYLPMAALSALAAVLALLTARAWRPDG